MRPWVPLVLAFAAFVAAQGSSSNVINNPSSGFQAAAGQPLTLTWTNPSSGTVTIKIQTSGNILPTDGIVVAQNIPNTGSVTFTVPPDVPAGQVFVQIIDDANPTEFNFSGGFQVQGATNTASVASPTASAATSSSDSASSTSESSATASSSSDSTSVSSESSASASSSSASASSSDASNTSRSSSASSPRPTASRTSASTSANAQGTTAPSNAAIPVKVQAGLLAAAVLGAAAVL